MNGQAKRTTGISFHPILLKKIDELAARHGLSRSAIISRVMARVTHCMDDPDVVMIELDKDHLINSTFLY